MSWYRIYKHLILLVAIVFIYSLFIASIKAQTTGKLKGMVTDETGESLIGANVLIEGQSLGSATDDDGYYSIINVRTGTYRVRFGYVGYQTKIIDNVVINSDRTTQLNVVLSYEIIKGEEVVVTAEKPLVDFNMTSSVATINKDDISKLPVQDLNEIVNLQAGVVDGHFRGGRLGEVQYQVDGVTVNNPYDNTSTLELDRSIIEEVQVISGTFDAKYGQAMSGVVNAVLKSGNENFEWSAEIYGGDYLPFDKGRYPNNEDYKPWTIQNLQLALSGPTFIPSTTFFMSGRRFIDDGYLFGKRIFVPTDQNDFETPEFLPTGDGKIIPMQTTENYSGQLKITNRYFSNLIFSYQAILNNIDRTGYNHSFRINPDGIKSNNTFSITHGFDFTHTLNEKLFYSISGRQNFFDYKDFKYEDLYDPRYLEAGVPRSNANYEDGAIVQGIDLGRFKQRTNSYIGKGQLTFQADRMNLLELGIEYQSSEVLFGSPGYYSQVVKDGIQVLLPQFGTRPEDPKIETYHPKQLAAYLQDRVEWKDLVIRAGLRFEYFNANAYIPNDLSNPANSISNAPESELVETTAKTSLAPRLGFSFPLTSAASVYFSYGHFYQIPNLSNIYQNSNYLILKDLQAGASDYGTLGNPDLNPQLTIQYEVGLKQALTQWLGLELTFFYKDIRELLGVEFISTYNGAEYTRFTNVDFGSAYGFTVSLDQRQIGPLTTSLDYTIQFANGNSSDPNETANRAEAGKDPRPRDIPFSWDQRHTLNAAIILSDPSNYSISTIVKIGSGQPFTPALGTGFNADLETNSGRKQNFVVVDFRAEKYFDLSFAQLSVFLRALNVLNTFNANGFVFSTTGSPDYSQFPFLDRVQLSNPSRFYEPRRIEIGVSFRSN
jgi:outer membrane receptor protein involved in Fe transport